MEASNLQELKDAATELMRFTCNSCEQRFCEEDAEEEDGRSVPSPCSAIIRMRNALSANNVRNCDVGTAEEQEKRFYEKFCVKSCLTCPLSGLKRSRKADCIMTWAQMPYEAVKGGEG